jgi:hypothetical protein
MGAGATLRTIVVESPSSRTETLEVLRALVLVGVLSALIVAVQVGDVAQPKTASEEKALYPFVTRFAELPRAEQRTFTLLREGIGEAERRRVARGAWPEVEGLAEDGIPPFAPDPIDRDVYGWSMAVKNGVVNYLGVPREGAARPAWVVIIAEPDGSGTAVPGDTPVDEIHHELDDGMRVHVAVFVGRGEPPERVVPTLSFESGWQQVLAGPLAALGR